MGRMGFGGGTGLLYPCVRWPLVLILPFRGLKAIYCTGGSFQKLAVLSFRGEAKEKQSRLRAVPAPPLLSLSRMEKSGHFCVAQRGRANGRRRTFVGKNLIIPRPGAGGTREHSAHEGKKGKGRERKENPTGEKVDCESVADLHRARSG